MSEALTCKALGEVSTEYNVQKYKVQKRYINAVHLPYIICMTKPPQVWQTMFDKSHHRCGRRLTRTRSSEKIELASIVCSPGMKLFDRNVCHPKGALLVYTQSC